MWDLRVANPFGRPSIRNMFVFAAATLAASLAYIFLTAPVTHAVDGEWNGSAITYQQNQYVKLADGQGPPEKGSYYAYFEESSTVPKKAHLIYFADGTDPNTATSASYVTYDYIPPATFSNPSGKTTISLTPQAAGTQGVTSCVVEGIGWIICPVTNFLADAMDWLFDILSSFLTVRPVQVGKDNVLFRAWSYMRNFANIAFVIAFLIIIYSQLSNIGLSNYSVKKMLPRLIIAVILVNISYWICAIAIDLSNIAGYSIQDIFISIRNSVVGGEGNSWDLISWSRMGNFILSGGAVALGAGAGIGIGIHTLLAGSAASALYLLLPLIVGVLVAVLIALLVLAARQAIITILVILSPLAFVAYLLPNTEKYFKKWHELGSTMLVMFPIFSIIFGGSQLAGIAIIQNADSIIIVLFGMGVQAAPVAVAPLIVRFSGSLLGKIAGIVNNPSKGLMDRTRNWSKERADQNKSKVLASNPTRKRDFLARRTQKIEANRRKREGWQKAHDAMAEARWENTHDSHAIHKASMHAGLLKEKGESEAQALFEASRRTNTTIQDLDMNVRANKLKVDLSKAAVEADWTEMKAGDARNMVVPAGLSVSALANYAHTRNALANSVRDNAVDTSIEERRGNSAQYMQTRQFAEALEASATLREQAGGIDPIGAVKAEASAMSEIAKAGQTDMEAGIKLLNFRAIKSNKTLKSLSSEMVSDTMTGTHTYSPLEVEAAFEAQAMDGQVVVLEEARMNATIDQTMLSQVIARNAGTLKNKGGFHLQADPSLANSSIGAMNAARASSLGDTSANNIKELKMGWVKEVSNNINAIIASSNPRDLEKAYGNVLEALENDQIRATIGDRITEIQNIELALRNQGYKAKPKKL